MGSFNAGGSDKGPDRRRGRKPAKRQGAPKLEFLEGRILLASDGLIGGNPIWRPTSVDVGDVQNGPMAHLGGQLIGLYQAQKAGGTPASLRAAYPSLQIRDDGSVLVGMTTWGDFNAMQSSLVNLGMKVTSASTTYGLANGWLPINQLYTASQIPNLMSGRPVYKPKTSFQGIADNQAQTAMYADLATTQYNVTGAGVTVGVLSDSFDSLGGYQTDISTGDLPAGITVLSDMPAGTGTDEGRAMLQLIYDISPGASLQFATAAGGQLVFAQNIVALADAGSDIIVDDIGYPDEPFFQDGILAQSINTVTAQGVPYFSAAGNSANHGYLSRFRGVQATIPGISDAPGRYMNFNGGSGAAATRLPLTVNSGGSIVFQFDQPFTTQQPVGSTNAVTSQVNIYVLDDAGAVVAQGDNNNVATQEPYQFVTIPTAGSYTVVLQVVSGPDPGHVQMIEWGGDMVFSQQFGTAGGTYYATSAGHPTAVNTIGVGATPWWATSPYLNQRPLGSEPFSAFGPSIYVRDVNGNLLTTPIMPQNPMITAPDGGNTTFFGSVIQTNNPPFPGQPATTTNLSQNLPSFFGTSAAAPNAAAVAALMLEKAPNSTVAEIRAGLIASAQPMNGSGPGVWNPQAGFGSINAVAAVAAVDSLTVASTTPAANTVVATTPSYIVVTYSKPVVASTLSASDIRFLAQPNGVTLAVGNPIPIDNPNTPTVVAYPFSFSRDQNVAATANGVYTYVVAGNVIATDGRALEQTGLISFLLQDVSAPQVESTNTMGRQVSVKFTKPMDPSTITKNNIIVARRNGAGAWNAPGVISLSQDPRATISYDPSNNTATLDFSALPQTALPSDQYAIIVIGGPGGVVDAVGNQLDGEFSGSFPSGNGQAGGNFLQDLGRLIVRAPVITSFALDPSSTNDTGIAGDSNTRQAQPRFIGQVFNSFPGTVANLNYVVQFNSMNGGNFDLSLGADGRGYVGGVNVSGVTDANGAFTFTAPTSLPEGFQRARVIAVGQSDQPPLPGAASQLDRAFRVDLTSPSVTGAALPDQSPFPFYVSELPGLSLYVQDVSAQAAGYLATPSNVVFPALDPTTAVNLSNYQLQVVLDNGTVLDVSQFITRATYVNLAPTYDASGNFIGTYQGRIDLSLAPGLPAGIYRLRAFAEGVTDGVYHTGLRDAAGNSLRNTGESTPNYSLIFALQRSPAYITNMVMTDTPNQYNYNTVGGPGSYYDLGGNRAEAPPTTWMFDFSNPLPLNNGSGSAINYSDLLRLVRSADNAGAPADGNFGNLGQDGLGDGGTGFTRVGGALVALYWQDPSTGEWQLADASHPHGTRLVMWMPGGLSIPDYYRVYIPNQINNAGQDSRIFDIYGNQLDGEFLGNPTSTVSTQFHSFSQEPERQYPGERQIFNYETLLTTGYASPAAISRMTGDGVGGGAFMAGFVVTTSDHILYTRPDYVEDPFDSSTAPDGSLAKPYPTLAPEGDPVRSPANPTRDPNGGLNSSSNFLSGFNHNYDRNGNGRFDRSVLYAAEQLAYTAPVVIVAVPGTPQRNPITGAVTQQPFVLQAPAGPNSWNNASASVPFNTTLVFTPGTTLKAQNASLFVQNQGSALQVQGNSISSLQVNFTSYNDASIGGATNGNPNTTPRAGDWGGIVFRNYNQRAGTRASDVLFPVDGMLKGVGTTTAAPAAPALAGADELMSRINFANLRYGGGAVPRSSGTTYSGLTLYNTRPSITNTRVTDTGTSGSTQGAIGADMDSFLQDDVAARGPLIRRVTVQNNSLNGIWMLSQTNGFIEPTDATRLADSFGQVNPASYALFQPLPLIVLAQLVVGQQYAVNTGGTTRWVGNRLYVDSGTMMRFGRNSSLAVLNPQASLNVGSRDYFSKFDLDPNYSPESADFKALNADDPQVLFTSLYDNLSTTTLVPNPINVTGGAPVTLGPALWGSIGIQSGARAVINAATFRYGGGEVNTPNITLPTQSVLSFITNQTTFNVPTVFGQGSRVYVTNNNFYNNFDAAMQVEPNGLLAGDPLRPLLSGHPFLRGNVMQGNGIDGLAVLAARGYLANAESNYSVVGPREGNLSEWSSGNQSVHALWDLTDITYVLRGTIVLAGGGSARPTPDPDEFVTPPGPNVSLTIQAALPGTLLADGTRIASPGAQVVVKLLTENNTHGAGDLNAVAGSSGVGASVQAGAGFIAGVDDGSDPDSSPFYDAGVWSQIRILGVPGNQSTGQQRIPVVITSLRDTTVGTTARGVNNYEILNSYPVGAYIPRYQGQSLTTPEPGDGGYIYIGGNSATTYNLTDPRQGSLIDNADLRYMTRIEIQGGGIVDSHPDPEDFEWAAIKSGYFPTPGVGYNPFYQLNARMAFRASASSFDSFADAAFFVHPSSANAIVNGERGSYPGQGVTLYLFNNTISNTPVGVRVNQSNINSDQGPSPMMLVLLNNTFYNNARSVHTVAPTFNNQNSLSHIYTLGMNNIFVGSSDTAVHLDGMQYNSQLQNNLFYGNAQNVLSTNNANYVLSNVSPRLSDPMFVDAANRNFALSAGSAAIDAGRSEIGPNPASNAVYPTVTPPANGLTYGPRTDPGLLTGTQQAGASNTSGGLGSVIDPRQILTLPGSGAFSFPDLWEPTLTPPPGSQPGPSYVTGSFEYQALRGQFLGRRDFLGFIRADDPSTPNAGTGSDPFTDIGAFEYVNLNPPNITAVTAIYAGAAGVWETRNFYSVGGVAGSNRTPDYVQFNLDSPLDPSSVNADTVLLQAMGRTASNVPGTFISLAGLITYDVQHRFIRVSLGAAGINLQTDAYRFILRGDGTDILFNTEGVALDGENLSNNNNPDTGVQLPLPSGDGYPGGDFFSSFIINTIPSDLVPGSFMLASTSDSNVVGDRITNIVNPTFTGTITSPNTGLVPLGGQTAILDIGVVSLAGNGDTTTYFDLASAPEALRPFIRPFAGTGVTAANGTFAVTVGQDVAGTGLVPTTGGLLSSPYNVGSSGNLIPIPGTVGGYYVARVRIVDQSGNVSNDALPTARVSLVVDTGEPTTAGTPLDVAVVYPTNGSVISNPSASFQFGIATNKNLDLTHLTASQIVLVRAGADGSFEDGTTIAIDASSFLVRFLDSTAEGGGGGKGRELITFRPSALLGNGAYRLTILGTDPNGVRDIAGNLLGEDVTVEFAVYSPSTAGQIFVGAGYTFDPTAEEGSRANPFQTIAEGIAAAAFGDRVAVLPGLYTESVVMRNQVSLVSAGAGSTDTMLTRGNALQTIIRPPAAFNSVSVLAEGLTAYFDPITGAALQTELSGFTIASSLLGDPAFGSQNPDSVGLLLNNSTMLVKDNYFINSGVGAAALTSGTGYATSSFVNNGFIGNTTGANVTDLGGTPGGATHYFVNNTFAYNTFGFWAQNSGTTGANQAYLANNIFWQNHDLTPARNGLGVYSVTPNHLVLNNNLFSGNGQSDTLPWWAAYNAGNGFDVAKLGPNAANAEANLGNFTGWPAFISPIDPRPGSDGPATFYLSADFGLAANSAAINNALASIASTTDFLGNPQNVNPVSRGLKLPGFGPRDVGAFEYIPTTTPPVTPPVTPPTTPPTTPPPAPAPRSSGVVDPTSNVITTVDATPQPAAAPVSPTTPVTVNDRAAARAAANAKLAAQRAARQAAQAQRAVAPAGGVRRTPPRFVGPR